MNEPPGSDIVVKNCQNSRSLSESGIVRASCAAERAGLAASTAATTRTMTGNARRGAAAAARDEPAMCGRIAIPVEEIEAFLLRHRNAVLGFRRRSEWSRGRRKQRHWT